MLPTMADDRAPPSSRVSAPAMPPTGGAPTVSPGAPYDSHGPRADTRGRVEKYFRMLHKKMGLTGSLTFVWAAEPDPRCHLEVAQEAELDSEITIYPDWLEQTPEYQRISAVHELVHKLWHPYTSLATAGLKARHSAAMIQAEEPCVEATARLLAPRFPLPKF